MKSNHQRRNIVKDQWSDDKVTDKSDYHAWKMSLDLALEDQDVMDYVQGKIHEHPSYFMRLTEITNDPIAIGELVDRELILIALGGLPRDWYVFHTTIINNKMIPDFDEFLTRCTQEETRMMERDHPSNGNRGDPTTFAAHAKKKNHSGPRNQNHGRVGPK